VTDLDQHPLGERFEVKQACPDCPTPLGALYRPPNPFCPWCRGTGLLTNAELAAWQRAQDTQ